MQRTGGMCLKKYSSFICGIRRRKSNQYGYPDGLSRKQIPLCARIMAVADVFDAVSAKRCYRDAMPLEQCFQIIEEGSGVDFDPIIAETFLEKREKKQGVQSICAWENSIENKET